MAAAVPFPGHQRDSTICGPIIGKGPSRPPVCGAWAAATSLPVSQGTGATAAAAPPARDTPSRRCAPLAVRPLLREPGHTVAPGALH